jgi:hypothetical protein
MSKYRSSLFEGNFTPPILRRIEDWKYRLIDLSRRNNLLYFEHNKRRNLLISRPDMEKIFARLVLRKRKLKFWYPSADLDDLNGQRFSANRSLLTGELPEVNKLVCEGINKIDLERILKNLHKRSLSDYRERGVRVLHAAFGMLVWKEKEAAEEVRSPLLLVPIELTRESIHSRFSISVPPVEEEVVLNPALQVKLNSTFKIDLPPLPEYWDYQSLSTYFNDIAMLANENGWRVETKVEIGLFSFHKLVIYNDLDTNAGLIRQHPIIGAMAGAREVELITEGLPKEKDVDKIQVPEKTFQVLDADSSQRVAIEYALRGQSFVMQGPPGTGKSQTIANIIAECIAQGKSVLFVSDKMAALEVVYKRLCEVGLSSFCLELHSSKANKREVVAELKRCLDETLVPRKLPSEHEFEKMKALTETLNNYVISLHKKRPILQQSMYDVLGELSRLECVPFVPVELPYPGDLTPQKMHELEGLMSRLKSVWQAIEEPDFPWRGYRGNKYNLEVHSELSTVLFDLISKIETFRIESGKFANQLGLNSPSTFDQSNWLIEIGNLLLQSPKPETSWVMHPNLNQLISEAEAHLTTFEWIKTTRNRLLERYNTAFFGLALNKSAEIKEILSAIDKLLLNPNIEESDLLKKRENLLDFAKHTQLLSEKWNSKSYQLAQMIGLPIEKLAPEHVSRLSRIVLFCFSEEQPESRWLDFSYFTHVKETFKRTKKKYEEHSSLRIRLAKTYTDGIFDIDLDGLIQRYNDLYTSSLRWLRPSYYRDQKKIAQLTHDGKVPKSVLQDLINARRLKILSAEIEDSAEATRNILGHFYKGYATDFQRAEKAIKTHRNSLH